MSTILESRNVYPQFLLFDDDDDDRNDRSYIQRKKENLALGYGIRPIDGLEKVVVEMSKDKFYNIDINRPSSVKFLLDGSKEENRFKSFEDVHREKIRSSWTNVKKKDRLRFVNLYVLNNLLHLNLEDMQQKSAFLSMVMLLKSCSSKYITYDDFKISSFNVQDGDDV